jgi:hypothetical protein
VAVVSSEPFLPNTVMFTVATAGYVPFVLNLHASLRRIGLGNHLVVYTPDRRVKRELSAMGVHSLCFGPQHYGEWSDFNTREFAKIMAYKWAVASEILNTGSNVLFVDGDIVFLRNPAKYLRDVMERTSPHLIMQWESPKNVYNGGFWFARPEPSVLALFGDIQDCLRVDKTLTDDQNRFNEIICQRAEIRIHALDAELFACGNQFLELPIHSRNRIDRSSNPYPIDSAYLLHFNYITGKERKVAAFKKCNAVFYPGLLTACNERILTRIYLSLARTSLLWTKRAKKASTVLRRAVRTLLSGGNY